MRPRVKRALGRQQPVDPRIAQQQRGEAERLVAEQEAARREARAARQVELARSKQRRTLENLLADDEDYVQEEQDDETADGEASTCNRGQPAGVRSGKPSAPPLSHEERLRHQELAFREQDARGQVLCAMLAPQHADDSRQDMVARLALLQQRVRRWVDGGALHLSCAKDEDGTAHYSGCPGTAAVVSWRPVLLLRIQGQGSLRIPTLRCSCCGVFEMHAAVIDCHASAPTAPAWWFEASVAELALELKHRGVATHSFLAVLTAMAQRVEDRQAEPRRVMDLNAKVFGTSMRHAHLERHCAYAPTACGADIFASAIGECAACAGAQVHPADSTQQQAAAALGAQQAAAAAAAAAPGAALGAQQAAAAAAVAVLDPGTAAADPLELLLAAAAVEGDVAELGVNIIGGAAAAPPPPSLLPKVATGALLPQALHPGITAAQRGFAFNADANVKLNHYASCGKTASRALRNMPPQLGAYTAVLTKAAAELQGDCAAEAGDGDGGGGCDAHLTCARETAKRGSGVVDQQNIFGAVCCHGVPIKSLFGSSSAYENFSLYAAMVGTARVLEQTGRLPPLETLLLDINCQFARHLKRHYGTLYSHPNPLRCFIGWLHAKAGHNLECQLEFSAAFADDMGRNIGEYVEQLWATLKPLARIQRYEALPHRATSLELALHHIAASKYARSWELLVQTFRHTERRVTQLQQEWGALEKQAQSAGVEIATGDEFALQRQVEVRLGLDQEYVKTLVMLRTYEGLASRGGAGIIGLDTSAGRALAAQVGDPQFLTKLRAQLAGLRRKLAIAEGSDWAPDSDKYQAAAAGLRTAMVRSTEVKIERHVSFLATLQADRGAEAQSGHNTKLVAEKIRYRARQIRELMSVWEAWMRFEQPPDFHPPTWDEADVFTNVLPWTAASGAAGLTEQHLRFRAYCISQEQRRCEEELRFLPQDAMNTLRYYAEQQQQLVAARAAAEATALQAAVPAARALARGKAYLARTWQARIAGMQHAAVAAFTSTGWVAAP